MVLLDKRKERILLERNRSRWEDYINRFI